MSLSLRVGLFVIGLALWENVADQTVAAARSLNLDEDRSRFLVEVRASPPPHEFTVTAEDFTAEVELNEALEVTAARFRFRLEDLDTGIGSRDAKMLEWSNAERFPEVRFALKETRRSNGQSLAVGDVWMNGQKQEVEVPYQVRTEAGRIEISGQTTVDYRHWGLEVISLLFIKVKPELEVRFELVGELAASAEGASDEE